jgi:hypothetical protein
MGTEAEKFAARGTQEEGRRKVQLQDLQARLRAATRKLYNAKRPQFQAQALSEVNSLKAQIKELRTR